jgi:hypothetical protein
MISGPTRLSDEFMMMAKNAMINVFLSFDIIASNVFNALYVAFFCFGAVVDVLRRL